MRHAVARLTTAGTVCLVGILVAGCSQAQPAARVSPTAQPTARATASAVASPGLAGDLPITGVDFSCRLPVVTIDPNSPGPPVRAGFISFPSGRFVEDPNGAMIQRGAPNYDIATIASPVLYGGGGGFYDRAAKRWVPTSSASTLADGSAYAYVTAGSIANIVDVASGKVRSFSLGPIDRPEVLDFNADGVYLDSPSAIGGPGEGVWLLHPNNGTLTKVGDVHRVWAVRDRKVWVARLDPGDQSAWPPMEIQPADSLAQVDLATGAETRWFYRAGAYPWMIGIASGRPLISVLGSSGQNEVRVLDSPGSDGTLVYTGSLVFDGYFQNYQGDGDRIWLGSERGIYLFRPNHGLQKVFSPNLVPNTGSNIQPGGFCQ
jgi:hypothetical protein